jgi:hypothetical protein
MWVTVELQTSQDEGKGKAVPVPKYPTMKTYPLLS